MAKKGASTIDDGEGTPLCLQSLKPISKYDLYCPHCGAIADPNVMYDPYFTIPGTTDFFGRLWRTAWKGKGKSGFKRVTAIMMIVLFWWPFFLIGLPWLLKRRRMNNDSRIDS